MTFLTSAFGSNAGLTPWHLVPVICGALWSLLGRRWRWSAWQVLVGVPLPAFLAFVLAERQITVLHPSWKMYRGMATLAVVDGEGVLRTLVLAFIGSALVLLLTIRWRRPNNGEKGQFPRGTHVVGTGLALVGILDFVGHHRYLMSLGRYCCSFLVGHNTCSSGWGRPWSLTSVLLYQDFYSRRFFVISAPVIYDNMIRWFAALTLLAGLTFLVTRRARCATARKTGWGIWSASAVAGVSGVLYSAHRVISAEMHGELCRNSCFYLEQMIDETRVGLFWLLMGVSSIIWIVGLRPALATVLFLLGGIHGALTLQSLSTNNWWPLAVHQTVAFHNGLELLIILVTAALSFLAIMQWWTSAEQKRPSWKDAVVVVLGLAIWAGTRSMAEDARLWFGCDYQFAPERCRERAPPRLYPSTAPVPDSVPGYPPAPALSP